MFNVSVSKWIEKRSVKDKSICIFHVYISITPFVFFYYSLWIISSSASLAFFLLPSKVHCSAVLVHDWRTFRSTCPINFRWCLVKCADPKKNSEPPPRLHERFCLPGRRGGGRGSEAWFRYFTLLCILRPPYPI